MRKILFMLFMLFSISIFAGNVSDNNESTAKDIILDKGDSLDHSSERPRTLIPITCVYVNGLVQLTIWDGIGEYTLTVTSQTTGERWSISNTPVLQTSTVSGTYWVEIETEDGSCYYGTYAL